MEARSKLHLVPSAAVRIPVDTEYLHHCCPVLAQ